MSFYDTSTSNPPINGCSGMAPASGVATCATSALAVGGHSIIAVYSGDTNFTTSQGSVASTVGQAGATTVVAMHSGSTNPSVVGQPVTFDATVSVTSPGAGNPTGTVQFFDGNPTAGGTPIGAAQTFSGSAVSAGTSGLAIGLHQIYAVFTPDLASAADFTASTSAPFAQQVGIAGTHTVLSSSANPAGIGQPVTYTAVVSVTPPGTGTLSGDVTFTDTFNGQSSTLGIVPLAGVATLTTSYSEAQVGAHSIVATFTSSNPNLADNGSNTVAEVVQGCAIIASIVVPHARLGVAAASSGGIQYMSLQENGGALLVLRPLTILSCFNLGTASKVRALAGIGADPIRLTFQYGTGGAVSGVVVQDETSGVTFTLPAPFLYGTGIHISAL